MNARVEVRDRLSGEEVTTVISLVQAATEADGVRPLNENVMLHLRHGGDPGARSFLLFQDQTLAGFAHLDPADPADEAEGPSGELVIHPGSRGRGLGRRLVDAVREASGGRLRLWAHGDHAAAAALAAASGFDRVRSLWQMRRSLEVPLPAAQVPEGVHITTFRPEVDEEAWVAVNARAFAHHPEQGSWTVEDVRRREQEPWFDPAGFFLAWRTGLVGFHWTKVHDGQEPIGEVYVVGVDPSQQGTGLGRALTLIGLAHLRDLGLSQVMLYADEDNRGAVHLYESLGFTRWDTDVMYAAG